MIYAILRFLRLLVPYGILVLLYRRNIKVPVALKTKSGRKLRAVMLTENYGIIVSETVYVANKLKRLKERQLRINKENEKLAAEFNALSFEMRENIFSKPGED